jgi:hypothetical protein
LNNILTLLSKNIMNIITMCQSLILSVVVLSE